MKLLHTSDWHIGQHAPLFYYRDKEKREIDLLIIQGVTVYPLEFKKATSPLRDDARHFAILENLNVHVGPGGVIFLTGDNLPLTEKAHAIPVSFL
jgi:predicted AAA+ superfamily ATPase